MNKNKIDKQQPSNEDKGYFRGVVWSACEILRCDSDVELAKWLLKKSGFISKIKDKNIEINKADIKILKKFNFI